MSDKSFKVIYFCIFWLKFHSKISFIAPYCKMSYICSIFHAKLIKMAFND